MGRPAPGYDIRIIDGEGKEVGIDQEGYIAVKVKPERPVGLFTKYVVSSGTGNLTLVFSVIT